nr:retrovirus-related Pol polyprotein from transposon TNT 1-94 [Tanacetum cinerariifolium]
MFNFFNNFSQNGQARNANPLALVATAQANQDPNTRHKGKEIAKPITPPSETASKEDSDPEQAQRDKDMQKNLALIAKYFTKIYKPINNNLETSSNLRNKNVDTTLRFKNDNQSGQFRNQRTVNFARAREIVGSLVVQQSGIQCFNCREFGHFAKECSRKGLRTPHTDEEVDEQELEAHYSYMAKIQEVPTANSGTDSEPVEQRKVNVVAARENVGSQVVQQSGIRCFNCKEFRHFAKECRKPKRVKDSAYHKEKMLLCKQAQQGVPLQAEQYDWLEDTDKEVDKQELEAHGKDTGGSYCRFRHRFRASRTVETDDSNVIPDLPDMCEDDVQNDQNDVESDDEQTSKSLGESISVRDSCLVTLQTKQAEFEKYKAFNDRIVDYDKLERRFVHELKQEMHADLKYIESLEKEIDELESDKAEFSDMYDVILQECVSKDVMCSYLQSLSDLDALDELQFMYLHKVKECDCLAQKLSNQTESVSKKVHNELLQRFAKVEKPSISLEVALQKCKPAPFLNYLDRIYFPKTKSVPKANVSEGLSKPVTAQTLPQTEKQAIVQLILFIVDSGCTKHMTGNLKLLFNFVEKFLGTVRFGNDQFAPILGYGDLVQGNVTINRVYYVEGLNHNLLSVGQFCDADLEVAFRKSTCFVRDLQGNDLLTSNRGSYLYTTSLQESTSSTSLCLMAKATPTQAWLWHRRLSYLNFDYINLLLKKDIMIGLPKLKYVKDQLCSSCELSKAKRSSFKSKVFPSSKGRLTLLHMDLCGPMRVASINGKKYIWVIVDDYSRYTWTFFLRFKDETPKVLKDFLMMIQRNLQALVITVRTDRGTEFLNKTLNAFFKEKGIEHQTSTARTPE